MLSSKQRVNRTAPPIFQNRRHNELREMYQHKATMITGYFKFYIFIIFLFLGLMLSPLYNFNSEKYYVQQCFNRFEPVGVGSFGYVIFFFFI